MTILCLKVKMFLLKFPTPVSNKKSDSIESLILEVKFSKKVP